MQKPIVIEPLDPAKHARAGFPCGIEQVDNFFRRTANKLAKAGNVCTFVMIGPEDALIGFYATNAHANDYTVGIARARFPPRVRRPPPPIPDGTLGLSRDEQEALVAFLETL